MVGVVVVVGKVTLRAGGGGSSELVLSLQSVERQFLHCTVTGLNVNCGTFKHSFGIQQTSVLF